MIVSSSREPLKLSELQQQRDSDGTGIECPACGCRHWRVRKTLRVQDGVRRYRVCRNCGRTRRTFEGSG